MRLEHDLQRIARHRGTQTPFAHQQRGTAILRHIVEGNAIGQFCGGHAGGARLAHQRARVIDVAAVRGDADGRRGIDLVFAQPQRLVQRAAQLLGGHQSHLRIGQRRQHTGHLVAPEFPEKITWTQHVIAHRGDQARTHCVTDLVAIVRIGTTHQPEVHHQQGKALAVGLALCEGGMQLLDECPVGDGESAALRAREVGGTHRNSSRGSIFTTS